MRIEQERLKALVAKQEGAGKRDIAINILLLPSLGAAMPNHEEEIALSKGKINAMDSELSTRCMKKNEKEQRVGSGCDITVTKSI